MLETVPISKERAVSSAFKSSRMAFFNAAPVPVQIDHGSLASRLNLPKLSIEIEREKIEEERRRKEEIRLRQEEEERIQREEEERLLREEEERQRQEMKRLQKEEEDRKKIEELERIEMEKEELIRRQEQERLDIEEGERLILEEEERLRREKEAEEKESFEKILAEQKELEGYLEVNNPMDNTLKGGEANSNLETQVVTQECLESSNDKDSDISSVDSQTLHLQRDEGDMIKLLMQSQTAKLSEPSSSSFDESEDKISSTSESVNDSEEMHSNVITIKGVTVDSTSDNAVDNETTIRNSVSSNDDYENTLDDASDLSRSRETVSTTSPLPSSDDESAASLPDNKKCHLANFSEFSSLSSIDSTTPARTPSTPGKRMFVEVPNQIKPSPWHSKVIQNNIENDIKKENSRSRSVDYSAAMKKNHKILPKSLSIQEITSKEEKESEIPLFSPIVKKITPSYIKDEDGDRNNNGNELVAVLVDEGTPSERTILIDDSKVTKTRGRTPRRHTTEPKFLSSEQSRKELFNLEREQRSANEFEDPIEKVEPMVVEITELRFIKQNETAKFIQPRKFEHADRVQQKREAERRPLTIENVRVLLDSTRPKHFFRDTKFLDEKCSNREPLQRTKSDQSSKILLRSQSESLSGSDRIKLQAAELEKKFSYKSQMKNVGEEFPIKKPIKKSSKIENLQKQITQLELSSGVKAFSRATERDVILRGRLFSDDKRDSPSRGSESQSEDSGTKDFFNEEIFRTDSSASKASSSSLKSDENDNKINNSEKTEKAQSEKPPQRPPIEEKRSEKLIRHLDAKRRFVSQDPEPIRIDPNSVFGLRSKSEDNPKHQNSSEMNGNDKDHPMAEKRSFPWTAKNKSLDTSLSSTSSQGSGERDAQTYTTDSEKPPSKPVRRPNSADDKQKRRSLLGLFKKNSEERSKPDRIISPDRPKSSKMKRRSKHEQKKLTEEILNSIPPSSTISPPLIDRKVLERLTTSNLTNVPTASEECLECGSEEEEEEKQMTSAEKEEKVKKMEKHLGKQQKKLEQKQLREAQQLQRNLQVGISETKCKLKLTQYNGNHRRLRKCREVLKNEEWK